MSKIILHVDMDAFFASVEQLDDKSLRGKPVIVGGTSERGVVSTCSYEARKYGVHSAMPIFIAQKLCPHGIYVRGRYWRYKEISEEVFSIFKEITPAVEPLSIDEAYLDLSFSECKDGRKVAEYIKKRVYDDIGLTLSVGISHNKFLAKLASDWNKPNGIMEITRDMVPDILKPLPIGKIHGLGQKSVNKLNNMGLFTVEDLLELPLEFFLTYLGSKHGAEVYDRIRGIDAREVNSQRDRKSFGKERTLKSDTKDKEELLLILEEFINQICNYLKVKNIKGKTITLKYKTSSFENHTRSKSLSYYTNDNVEILEVVQELLENEVFNENIRLIGVSISSFNEFEVEQLSLF